MTLIATPSDMPETEHQQSAASIAVSIQTGVFDVADEIDRLVTASGNVGGVVTFTGHCRDESGTLSALELEHYPGMAEAEIERICQLAAERWPLFGVRVVHRFGKLEPGEAIVLVAAASRHRKAAFAASEFVMDFLKTNAPFWKKEHRIDGTQGAWVDAREADDEALKRWNT